MSEKITKRELAPQLNQEIDQMRINSKKELRTEVVSSFPSHAEGRVIYHTVDKRYYGSVNGEWV